MNKEYIVYGLPEGETRKHMEEIVFTTASERNANVAKQEAKNYGWHKLRIAIFDPRRP